MNPMLPWRGFIIQYERSFAEEGTSGSHRSAREGATSAPSQAAAPPSPAASEIQIEADAEASDDSLLGDGTAAATEEAAASGAATVSLDATD